MLPRRVNMDVSFRMSMSSDYAPSHCAVNHQQKQPKSPTITTERYPSKHTSISHHGPFQDHKIAFSTTVELNIHNVFKPTDKAEIFNDDIPHTEKTDSTETSYRSPWHTVKSNESSEDKTTSTYYEKCTNDNDTSKADHCNTNNGQQIDQPQPAASKGEGIANTADPKEPDNSGKDNHNFDETTVLETKESFNNLDPEKCKPPKSETQKVDSIKANADEKARSGCEKDMNDTVLTKDGCSNKNKPEPIKTHQTGESKDECCDNGEDPKEAGVVGEHANGHGIMEDEEIFKFNAKSNNEFRGITW